MKVPMLFVLVVTLFLGCESVKKVLPPSIGQIIKDTNTDQHIGIKMGGTQLDLLKVDKGANALIKGFIGSLLEKQDMCMKETAKYFHESLRKGTCVKPDLAQYSLMVTKMKVRASYPRADSYDVDSIYLVENKEIEEKGKCYTYFLNDEKTRKVQVFFPESKGHKKITDFHFIR